MDSIFDRVTIVGAGLLGASLGLALQQTGAARHITGVGRRQGSLDTALAARAVHEVSLDLAGAVARADLVVIATPANSVIATLDTVLAAAPDGAIIIDVASTKAAICAHASARCGKPRRFIGCHPMAGSEKSGPEHASAALYENSVCLIEDDTGLDREALSRVQRMWQRVGARVVTIDAARHDAMLACTSHVPHILASVLATVARAQGATRDLAGNGFRDTTRIAEGSPEMWRDITLTNRAAIAEGIAEVRAQLARFSDALEVGDGEALMALFDAGKDARRAVLSE